MCAAISQSDAKPLADEPFFARAQRTSGVGRVSFKADAEGRSRLDRLYQQGCAKIRLPKVYGGRAIESVLINSAGGLTGGDNLAWHVGVGAGAYGVATTQACEKIYKSTGADVTVSTRIDVADGGRCDWLPQETIIYDRARLKRSLEVHLTGSARFLAIESVLLGRTAMGERVHSLFFSDQWRVYRDGRLVHADAVRLEGDADALGGKAAILSGHSAFASLCFVGPEDAEALSALADRARQLAGGHGGAVAGISAFGGKLVARLSAPSGLTLRALMIPLISLLRGEEPLPRVWTT